MALPTLATLPDDVLLELFRFLDTRQLLLARGVCRRWRDLALYPHAWKHRSLCVEKMEDLPLQIAVLSLAPCLYDISFDNNSLWRMDQAGDSHPRLKHGELAWRAMARLCVKTTCNVRSLRLVSDYDGLIAAKILKNQLALPSCRLRRLHLTFIYPWTDTTVSQAALLDLMQLVLGAPRLSELHIIKDGWALEWPTAALCNGEPASNGAASLKRLKYSCGSSAPDSLLQFLVTSHAATLELVQLYWSGWSKLPPNDPVFSLLARCPNLNELHCPLDDGIGELARRRSLTELSVYRESYINGMKLSHSVYDFFKGATQLKALTIRLSYNIRVEESLRLLLELSSSGQSALETLEVIRPSPLSDSQWKQMAAALPGLPQLRKLGVYCVFPPISFLLAVTPSTAPRLQWLAIKFHISCALESIPFGRARVLASEVVSELRAALRRNPGLHVWGLYLKRHTCRKSGVGQSCWQGLQGLPDAPLQQQFGMFSHAQGERCDLHQDGESWVRIDCDAACDV